MNSLFLLSGDSFDCKMRLLKGLRKLNLIEKSLRMYSSIKPIGFDCALIYFVYSSLMPKYDYHKLANFTSHGPLEKLEVYIFDEFGPNLLRI